MYFFASRFPRTGIIFQWVIALSTSPLGLLPLGYKPGIETLRV